MGIFHEILIVVGLMLVLMIGWAASLAIQDRFPNRTVSAHQTHEGHTCRNGLCALPN